MKTCQRCGNKVDMLIKTNDGSLRCADCFVGQMEDPPVPQKARRLEPRKPWWKRWIKKT